MNKVKKKGRTVKVAEIGREKIEECSNVRKMKRREGEFDMKTKKEKKERNEAHQSAYLQM